MFKNVPLSCRYVDKKNLIYRFQNIPLSCRYVDGRYNKCRNVVVVDINVVLVLCGRYSYVVLCDRYKEVSVVDRWQNHLLGLYTVVI